MKRHSDAKQILNDNKGETIMEVVVAFLVLSIMLALFAQGIRYANNARIYAMDECEAADTAVIELQKTINYDENEGVENGKALMTSAESRETSIGNGKIVAHQYVVSQASGTDIRNYYYWVYEVKDS